MTNNMAECLFRKIIITLDDETSKNNIPAQIQDRVLEECISIIVDEYGEKSLLFLDKKPVSVKLPNVTIDLRKALVIIGEMVLASSLPETEFDAVKMVLLVILKVWQLSHQYISEQMVDTVLQLHKLNAYNVWIEIDEFKKHIEKNSKLQHDSEPYDVDGSLNELYSLKIIDIVDNKVQLKEKIAYSK